MTTTRHQNDFSHTTEWTDTIVEMENQSSFFKNMGLFRKGFTDQTAILFDKIENQITLLPSSDRRGGKPSYGKDDKVSTFSLKLGYFWHQDTVTKQDIQSKRKAGTADQKAVLADAIADKLRNARNAIDQTHEYMMIEAVKGACRTPDGVLLADMFAEFGITQTEIDFDLGNLGTDVSAKIAELKDTVIKNLKTGGIITGPLKVVVGRDFYNKLKDHPKVSQAYLNSESNVRYQEDASTYYTWGISDVFTFNGVQFLVYSHTFTLPDGTTATPVGDSDGHVIPEVRGASIFRAYYGPSQSFDSDGGQEMFAFEYNDNRGRSIDMEFETAPLMFCEKPAALVKITTTT